MTQGEGISPDDERRDDGLSARRIVGFACNQGFLLYLLGHGLAGEGTLEGGVLGLGRASVLLALVLGFAVVRVMGSQRVSGLFARPLLYAYAVVAAMGSLLTALVPEGGALCLVLQGILTGIPCALLLTAWGRVFGCAPIRSSVAEVFLGSLVGALLCLLFTLVRAPELTLVVTRVLPLGSVVNIAVPRGLRVPAEPAMPEEAGQVRRLSSRMLVGAFLYGAASGLLGLFDGAAAAGSFYRLGLVLFGAYLLGSLSILLSDGFGRGAALGKSYRLAVLLMLAGILLVPVPLLAQSIMPGQSFALAGYLGLETALIGLFVVMARLSGTDCALEFSSGFLALYAGELVGMLGSQAMGASLGAAAAAFLVAAAGIVALLGYIFFFTDRDFDTLSQMESGLDSLEQTCARLVARYGLSAREAEILGFALRGRTNERIAQELVIAKSTVDTHLRRIYAKCGVHSRQELLDLAEASPE